MITSNSILVELPIGRLQSKFLAFLPRIERHARIVFRDVTCTVKKADYIAETIALAWKWFLRLAARGKDATQFASALATYAARAVRSGRRLCGQLRSKDVLSETAQRRHGFTVESCQSAPSASHKIHDRVVRSSQEPGAFEERLRDNVKTPVPDQVAFRLDWPAFYNTLPYRDRQLAEFLSHGHSAKRAADRFQLTPGRVTQLRQQWCRQWRVFQEDAEAGETAEIA